MQATVPKTVRLPLRTGADFIGLLVYLMVMGWLPAEPRHTS